MSWKKSKWFFVVQALKYSRTKKEFTEIMAFRQKWFASFDRTRNSVNDESAWLTQFAISFLEQKIRQSDVVFEFGGGGSSLFFCKNAQAVYTVEDHPDWFKTLSEIITQKGYNNWTGHFVPAEKYTGTQERNPGEPSHFQSGAVNMQHLSFEKYATSINQYPNQFFDWVLVDGRARPSCIQQAIPHIKPGGYLVLDNSDRPYYLSHISKSLNSTFEIVLDRIGPTLYTPDFTQTTIFQKK
jgi:hypothetical protein